MSWLDFYWQYVRNTHVIGYVLWMSVPFAGLVSLTLRFPKTVRVISGAGVLLTIASILLTDLPVALDELFWRVMSRL